MLETWEDEFIPSGIMDSIIHYNADQHECKVYATELNYSNFENDLDVAMIGTGIEGDYINSGCIYSDIDDQRQNSTLQLLFIVVNIKPRVFTTNQPISTTISYHSSGQLVLLNDWEDPHYFTFAFSCLFLFGTEGHLVQRKGLMSLEAWVKWTLQHHSHR